MTDLGFRFQRAGQEGEGVVRYSGERSNGDGTKIEIIITKGEGYRSPKEIVDQDAEQTKEKF
ncbi:MAG: hypothetical protein Q8P83_01625 [bacterium]|nr:hypothetical protein [bacterium]